MCTPGKKDNNKNNNNHNTNNNWVIILTQIFLCFLSTPNHILALICNIIISQSKLFDSAFLVEMPGVRPGKCTVCWELLYPVVSESRGSHTLGHKSSGCMQAGSMGFLTFQACVLAMITVIDSSTVCTLNKPVRND